MRALLVLFLTLLFCALSVSLTLSLSLAFWRLICEFSYATKVVVCPSVNTHSQLLVVQSYHAEYVDYRTESWWEKCAVMIGHESALETVKETLSGHVCPMIISVEAKEHPSLNCFVKYISIYIYMWWIRRWQMRRSEQSSYWKWIRREFGFRGALLDNPFLEGGYTNEV